MALKLAGKLANFLDPPGMIILRAMRSVQSKNIDPRFEEGAHDGVRVGGRSKGGNDLSGAHSKVFCKSSSYATIARAHNKKEKILTDLIMPLYQAIVLAIIQGFTEFLPVSSTAHLTIIPALLHWKDPGLSFDVALARGHARSGLSVLFRDWVQVILNGIGISYRGARPDENSRSLLWLLVLGHYSCSLGRT
jgi:hypothetical protein